MFQKLVSHNDDLKRLVEKGFAVAFDNYYLIIRDIPYLDSGKNKKIGVIVTKLNLADENKVNLENHQIFWSGSHPHNINGEPIPNLGSNSASLALGEKCSDIKVESVFSNKPIGRDYEDFFEKINSYVNIISGPAMELFSDATPYTFRVDEDTVVDQIFKINDTLTSRAEIVDLSAKFKDEVIAVIGLGGTGSYILDFLVKTPVKEIKAFDFDLFYVHNAFRTPGKVESSEFNKPKVEAHRRRFENFRNGLTFLNKAVDASSVEDFTNVTFAFVCVDSGSSRKEIFDLLISKNIPFIDVGMGLNRKDGLLNGMVRTTYYSKEDASKLIEKKLAPLADEESENLYRANIQIGELNALNACLAIIKYKQIRGFYSKEDSSFYNFIFEIEDLKVIGESKIDED